MLHRILLIALILFAIHPISAIGQDNRVLLLAPEENPEYLVSDLMLKIEGGAMIGILEDAGYRVDVATASDETIVAGMSSYEPDYKFSEININDYVGLMLPSMKAPRRKSIPSEAARIIRQFAESGKPIAAQVYGIAWLGEAGVLSGRKFSFISAKVNNARLKRQLGKGIFEGRSYVVKDKNIVTSGVCPDAASQYNLPDGTARLTEVFIEEIRAKQE